ncbi:MAG: hypothetical protein LLG00_11295 [Planctomycetaceae bacterium]|nr:hypothetical protein [Planctomycetaceae bacterium]
MHFAETAKFAIKVLLVSVFVFGAVAVGQPLLSGIFATLGLRMRSTWWRLALSVDDIVVDKNGTVYIWNGERIQVYDSDGRFLNGWSFGKTGWLLLGQDGASIIAVRHYRSSVRFDAEGRQLEEKRDDPRRYERIINERSQHGVWTPAFEDGTGNVYRQEGRLLHSIVRVDPTGRKTVIIRDSVYVGIFNPILGILLVVLSYAAWRLLSLNSGF